LKAPRAFSACAQIGICGGGPPGISIIKIGAIAPRMVGSAAINKRERFTPLLAAYSAIS
jgi:hypothetical protein